MTDDDAAKQEARAASRALSEGERRRMARDILNRARQLRDEVRQDLSLQRWGADDLQMERYNRFARVTAWLYADNPAVGDGLIVLPDAMLQSYGTLTPINKMPSDLPARRIEGRLTVLIERLEMILGEAADAATAGLKTVAAGGNPQARRRVFISHSGESTAFHRLLRFLWSLGVEPVVAEWLPFSGRLVPEHVRATMDSCECALVLATGSDEVGERKQPGRGVLIETGILQERFGERVIYLVEEGAQLGPMADGFARESFTQDNLERAFERIVVELKAHSLI